MLLIFFFNILVKNIYNVNILNIIEPRLESLHIILINNDYRILLNFLY